MTPLAKILIALSVVLTISILSLIVYNQYEHKTQLAAIQTQVIAQQQLVDGIVRSQDQYATKQDINSFAQQNGINLKAIQDNLDKLGAQLTSVNVATTNSTGQTSTNVVSTNTGPSNPNPVTPITVTCPGDGGVVTCPNQDQYGYLGKQQDLVLNEEFGALKVPFGSVGFSAWQPAPWNFQITPRTYNVATVVGVDENERQVYYNKFTVNVAGKDYDIPITNSTTKQEVPAATWSWWNPRLLMGIESGVNVNHFKGEFSPSISLGIMSWGQSKRNPDFSILEVGASYGVVNKTPGVIITPVAYNIGKKLFSPVMNNTYIGPFITINTDGSFTAGAALRVGF